MQFHLLLIPPGVSLSAAISHSPHTLSAVHILLIPQDFTLLQFHILLVPYTALDFQGRRHVTVWACLHWKSESTLSLCVLQVTDVRSAIQSALKFFTAYKQQKQPEDPFPLLVVDEANFMQDWQSESERKSILAFFVDVSV